MARPPNKDNSTSSSPNRQERSSLIRQNQHIVPSSEACMKPVFIAGTIITSFVFFFVVISQIVALLALLVSHILHTSGSLQRTFN